MQAQKFQGKDDFKIMKRDLTGDIGLEGLRTRFGARPEPLQRTGFSLPKQSLHQPSVSGYMMALDNYEVQIK